MKSVAALEARLGELHQRTRETPLFNPVFQLSLDLSRALEGGEMGLDDIEALVADERTKAVLVKHIGPIDQHPAYDQFKAMSLRDVAPYSQGMITDEKLAQIDADLAAIK